MYSDVTDISWNISSNIFDEIEKMLKTLNLLYFRLRGVRKRMTLSAQKLKMRCAHKPDSAALREAEGHVQNKST
jgi:hypothetical protein